MLTGVFNLRWTVFGVSWCRLDLVLLHGPDTADVFLTAYREAAQTEIPDIALWDLSALSNSHQSVESWLVNYHALDHTESAIHAACLVPGLRQAHFQLRRLA